MALIEVEKTIKVQADVNKDFGVAEYSGQFFAVTDGKLGIEIKAQEIGERIINFARVKYGLNLVDTGSYEGSNNGVE